MDASSRGPLSGTRRGTAREGDPGTPGGARECQELEEPGLTVHGVRQKTLRGQRANVSGRSMFH